VARFLKHTACPVCGSSDALGVYDDGSTYCFSHGRSTKQATISPFVTTAQQQDVAEIQPKTNKLPEDATQNYSVQALAWAAKYEISVQELLSNQVYYSPARNQLIFSFWDTEGRVLAWQARNLSATDKGRRYYTQGDINDVLPIYRCRDATSDHPGGVVRRLSAPRKLVLVEDCLSAIKVASVGALGADAMPLLGSSLPKTKLTQLRGSYDLCDVFLDPDMWPKSLMLAKQAEMLGFKVRSIRADCDPKEMTREGLTALLS
jgi:hypothetical protein